jgi:hypothetical protein
MLELVEESLTLSNSEGYFYFFCGRADGQPCLDYRAAVQCGCFLWFLGFLASNVTAQVQAKFISTRSGLILCPLT